MVVDQEMATPRIDLVALHSTDSHSSNGATSHHPRETADMTEVLPLIATAEATSFHRRLHPDLITTIDTVITSEEVLFRYRATIPIMDTTPGATTVIVKNHPERLCRCSSNHHPERLFLCNKVDSWEILA